ncbi:hypothetical protein JAAARDRAFT_155101 [Jaapia argillacea MUCL 33604]|uniref:RRM domain-containing protein n=1 Tax=Jaapia argillacea MUCL 33604 TaxID=933084 RepID=A0A067Q505_9AGAM|nr:hypothetical protein JAAARDRAFT_155101 [Jaapia argillacea MUCL 33604]
MAAPRFDRSRKPYSRPTLRSRAPEGAWTHDKAPGSAALNGRANGVQHQDGGFTKLVVSNLHYEINTKDLTSIFGQIGTLVREPLIKYDRSGRSTGVGIISFETAGEATRAKNQFDGVLAKGQPMSISFDTVPPPMTRKPRRVVSDPSSLISRIQKPALLDRLSRDDSGVKVPPTAPRSGLGPIRSRPRGSGRPGPKKPKTVEDLDKELDAFMGDSSTVPAADPAAQSAPVVEGDVEMSA